MSSFCGRDKESKPNIVLILADDLGYGDLSCYGNKTIKTPNIDALAKGGMKFTDFHSNGPMCSPTRAALLTGRYQQRCGIEGVLGFLTGEPIGMSASEVTFAEVMKSAGYATGIFGKCHTGHFPKYSPVRQGFDTFRGCYGGLDYHSHVNRIGQDNWWKNEELVPEQGYVTDLLTNHAERFIDQHKDEPFCLYVPHFAVHFPWQGPNDKADFLPGVDNSSFDKKRGSRKDKKNAYREMLESLDDSVGRIVNKIKRLGLERKTFIFFVSDNGAYNIVGSNAPLAGQKGSLLEGGHRVPAIAYWPGTIKPGTSSNETAMTMDVFPTMVSIAGTKLPAGLELDGVDLLPTLTQTGKLPQRSLFWRHRKEKVIRKGPWKLLFKDEDRYFYNLADDIGEKNDLAQAKPEMVKAMEAEFLVWEADVTAGVTWVRK
jgi:arylsulfatase A-like enzyme